MSYTGICIDGPLKGQSITSQTRHLQAVRQPVGPNWLESFGPLDTVIYQFVMWRTLHHEFDRTGSLLTMRTWDTWEPAWVCGRDF